MNERQAEVLKASAAAQAARERLNGTVMALQGRVHPRALAREVRHSLGGGGGGGPVAVARRHPVAAAGLLGVLGLLLVRRARRRRHATGRDEARSRFDA